LSNTNVQRWYVLFVGFRKNVGGKIDLLLSHALPLVQLR
jgi:hypothetical protein